MLNRGWGLRSDSVKRGNNARKRQKEGVSGEISGDRGGKGGKSWGNQNERPVESLMHPCNEQNYTSAWFCFTFMEP